MPGRFHILTAIIHCYFFNILNKLRQRYISDIKKQKEKEISSSYFIYNTKYWIFDRNINILYKGTVVLSVYFYRNVNIKRHISRLRQVSRFLQSPFLRCLSSMKYNHHRHAFLNLHPTHDLRFLLPKTINAWGVIIWYLSLSILQRFEVSTLTSEQIKKSFFVYSSEYTINSNLFISKWLLWATLFFWSFQYKNLELHVKFFVKVIFFFLKPASFCTIVSKMFYRRARTLL